MLDSAKHTSAGQMHVSRSYISHSWAQQPVALLVQQSVKNYRDR